MSGAGDTPERAWKGYVHRTIPNRKTLIASPTTASATSSATALAGHLGRYVWLLAKGGDVTVMRGAHTMIALEGLVCRDGVPQEMFLDPAGAQQFSHIASASCSLLLLDDNEIS